MRNNIYFLCKFCEKNKEKVCYCKSFIHTWKYKYKKPERTEALKKSNRKASRKYYYSNYINKQKAITRVSTARAIKNGKLVRQPCIECGELKSETHHTDYSKPYEGLLWLCKKHHEDLHHRSVNGTILV